MDAEELIDNFEFFDDWEDRYAYLIDLGKNLTPMEDALKTEDNRVKGCMSMVWVVLRPSVERNGGLDIIADSDSAIVRGLVGIVQVLYGGRTPAEMRAVDIDDVFHRIGLDQHLSPNRRNGFYSMIQMIKRRAAA